MQVGAASAILDGLAQGADSAAGVVALAQAQMEMSTQLLVEMFALQAANDAQGAAALALLQSAMGVGRHVDLFA